MLLENQGPVGMSTTFWHVVLTDSWEWVCQLCGSDLETMWTSLVSESHYRTMTVR